MTTRPRPLHWCGVFRRRPRQAFGSKALWPAWPILAVVLFASACPASGGQVLRLDANTTYQTFEGWGIVLPCWLFRRGRTLEQSIAAYDASPNSSPYTDALNRALAEEMVGRGFNRFRLEVGPQVEFRNDNDDPNSIDWTAYRFKWQDSMVREQLLPMKKLLDGRGEPTVVYISYDLGSAATPDWLLEPAEYAELAVATLSHLKRQFGLEPNYWSVLNEPGNGGRPGDPELVARLTAAAGRRIAAEGYKTRMSGPECVTPKQVDAYMKALAETPGALDRFAQITYHLYWDPMTVEHRRTIRRWSQKLNVPAAQTEWMEQKDLAVCTHIHLCLTVACASAWERYAWDIGTDVARQTFRRKSTAWYMRQYSRYIRPGAVRVKLDGPDGPVRAVALLSPNRRRPVVVLLNPTGDTQSVTLANLPAGRYWQSEVARAVASQIRPVAVSADGTLTAELAPRSVWTVTGELPPGIPPEEIEK